MIARMLSENWKASSLSPAERTLMITRAQFFECIRLVMFSGRKSSGMPSGRTDDRLSAYLT